MSLQPSYIGGDLVEWEVGAPRTHRAGALPQQEVGGLADGLEAGRRAARVGGAGGGDVREAAERRRQMLKDPDKLNEVLQGDFTDYTTEDGEKYRIGCITEYLSRFNLVSEVLDTETALDLIAVTEAALREATELGHELAAQVILVTDNGPAMKSRRFRNFVKKTALLVHVRSRKYHPQTLGREERYHGSLKLEHLYRVLPNNRSELIEAVSSYRRFYNYERLHMSLGYRTPAAVYLTRDGHKL